MQLSGFYPSVCLSVCPSLCPTRPPLLWVYCCGSGGQEMLIDRSSTAHSSTASGGRMRAVPRCQLT